MFPLIIGLLAGLGAVAPLRHEAYVWQRAWTAPVRSAVAAAPLPVTVLAAEVGWQGGRRNVVRVRVDHATLAGKTQPVGLAIRVGAFRGPFDESSSPASLAASVIAEARAAGLEPAELQIDFDCAESKLVGYATWVRSVRAAVAPTPVTITALPAWLNQRAFAELIGACDEYVLQVHSLDKPGRIDEAMTLCDPDRARRWLVAASRFGRPFRVALPTYGYRVSFDAKGSFTGLSAEGGVSERGNGESVRFLGSDAAAMADLVRDLSTNPPQHLTGIIWYRLPVKGDELNWTWATLAKVMRGERPAASLKLEVRSASSGLYEIELSNAGDADATVANEIAVRWSKGTLLAADAFAGFGWNHAGGGESTLRVAPDLIVRPGERRRAGWVRLVGDQGATVHATFSATP